ncbi:hypothetical protein QO034_13765 [Sedimentitalea sp. JM2-8]|uniref:Uncharacterized protein n=1 Tax=Sedimentitalea xiamensis TaxID=3050037 RepID=A0ABT7FGD6_9RHOB|nr:hypothetical protein [Sedimentitalea xiamensis]MDK3074182.1 hypothetical protein [Sedimentitalea xiamensis]
MRVEGAGRLVRRRRVFYVPGYDPVHARRYRELYRREAAEQARISGYRIELSARTGGPIFGWHVMAEMDGATVRTDVEVLVWSDLVRASMSGSVPATYLQMIRTVGIYVGTGAFARLARLRKGPVIAALYPVLVLVLQLGLAATVGWLLALAVIAFLGGVVGTVPAAALACGSVVIILRWFRARDGTFFAYYLMHDFAYSTQGLGADPPELEARIAVFAERIGAALQDDVDEVLVVGHSSGVHVAVSVLAQVAAQGRAPALGFLSLGQVVPMVSFLPGARRLRRDLRVLSTREDLTWVDVSAPGDGCSFALCDPVAVSGVAPPGKRWPLVISAAFTQTLSEQRWSELRWRFFRLHFQYLCAFDRPGVYDYFRITAGPETLRERFAGRSSSASRIDVPVSGYTSVAP